MGYWFASLNLLLVRIMHFTDTYLPRRDGVITSLRTLVCGLASLGHESVVVVPRHKDQVQNHLLVPLPALPCGVADLRLARWAWRPLRPALLARLAAHAPDIIHVHTPGPTGLLGVAVAQRLGLPLVQTYHTDLHAYADAYRVPAFALRLLARLYARRLRAPAAASPSAVAAFLPNLDGLLLPGEQQSHKILPERPPRKIRWVGRRRQRGGRAAALDWANKLLLGNAGAVVVPTAAVLERVSLPVDPEKVYLIPTGVAPPRQAADISHWDIDPDDKVVLFVGRVNREKGIELLLPAFDRVLAAEPRARLVLIGAVYEPRWLRRMLHNDRVLVTGQQPPEVVAAAYERADVFAFPSGTDTQALVLQEAALAGVPSVLIDRVLVERGALAGAAVLATPDTFGDAILGLLRDPARAKEIGEQARVNAARHSPQAFTAAILGIYGKFVPCGRTRSATPARADAAHSAA